MENSIIEFYCKKCGKSYRVSYVLTGDDAAPISQSIVLKCHRCNKVATLMKYNEGMIRKTAVNGICHI